MKRKSLFRQAEERLKGMEAYGDSKHADKLKNSGKPDPQKIYSYNCMKNYLDVAHQFTEWVKDKYRCRALEEARQYVGEYLELRKNSENSAWTVRRDAAALAKLFGCQTTDFDVELPVRRRRDIKQHRKDKWVGHFAPDRHPDLVILGRGTGLRRCEIQRLAPDDVYRDDNGSVVVLVRKGKGGKMRRVPALPDYADQIAAMAQRAKEDGLKRLIDHVPKYAPCHLWRREYALAMYDAHSRDTSTLPKKQLYICRADKAGHVYDREAMAITSQALGHNRLDVIAMSYLDVVPAVI